MTSWIELFRPSFFLIFTQYNISATSVENGKDMPFWKIEICITWKLDEMEDVPVFADLILNREREDRGIHRAEETLEACRDREFPNPATIGAVVSSEGHRFSLVMQWNEGINAMLLIVNSSFEELQEFYPV